MIPFQVTQEYPIYTESEGTLQILVKNTSDDTLLFKVLTSKNMVKNLFLNQIIFAVRPNSIEKVIATYKPPLAEKSPKVLFQAFVVGDQDPATYDGLSDARKTAWDNNIIIAKENGTFSEMQMAITFTEGARPIYNGANDQNKQLAIKQKLRDMQEIVAKEENELTKLENEIICQMKIVNRDQEIISLSKNKIQKLKNAMKGQVSLGPINYSHMAGVFAIVIGIIVGYVMSHRK